MTTHTLYDLYPPTVRQCSTADCENMAVFTDRARTRRPNGIVLAFYPLCFDCAIRLGFTKSHGEDEHGYKKVTKLKESC